jgi:nucleoside-diphosphate-sugar epimerase
VEGQRLLVVGGAGFVGSNLVRMALEGGARRVVVVDNLLSAERENLPSDARLDFREGSIADDAVLAALEDEFETVFHLATFHGNQNSIADPMADHANNLITTLKLYERLRGFRRVRKVVYAATGCALAPHTFEQAEATPEDGPLPLEFDSPYQISKVTGELYSVYYHTHHGLPTVRARFQNVYGPGEVLGAGAWRGTAATVWRNVVPTFVYRALKGMPLRVDNGGVATRDFIYVDDIVRGLFACATAGRDGDVYNLASGNETTILDLARLVTELAGSASPVESLPRRAWDHSGKRFGSTEKSARMLGFRAGVELRDGLERTVSWTRANLDFVDRCVEKHRHRLEGGLS